MSAQLQLGNTMKCMIYLHKRSHLVSTCCSNYCYAAVSKSNAVLEYDSISAYIYEPHFERWIHLSIATFHNIQTLLTTLSSDY